jgi:hypothetical protein
MNPFVTGFPSATLFFRAILGFSAADLPVSPARRNRPQHRAKALVFLENGAAGGT